MLASSVAHVKQWPLRLLLLELKDQAEDDRRSAAAHLHALRTWTPPTSVTSLTLQFSIDQEDHDALKDTEQHKILLPHQLQSLHLNNDSDVPLDAFILPLTLTHLTVSQSHNCMIEGGRLPPSLQSLTVANDHDLNPTNIHFPSTLQRLDISLGDTQRLHELVAKLPQGLQDL